MLGRFAREGDEAVWRSALDGAAIALPDACKNTYYYRCASRQAWSGPASSDGSVFLRESRLKM